MVKKGWHQNSDVPPHKGKAITANPLRTRREVAKVKRVLGDKPRDLALFLLGINSGLRASDLLNLRWEDLLTEEDEIKRRIQVEESRSDTTRVIPLGQKARDALEDYRDELNGVERGDYVFPGRAGNRMTVQRLSQLVNKWAELAELDGSFSTHTLRKTYAHHLLKQGISPRKVMKALGHSSVASTVRYAGFSLEKVNGVVPKLDL